MKYKKETALKLLNDLKNDGINNDNIIKVLNEALSICGVVSSFNLSISDKDIATIEAMHDILLDEKILGLNARCMKESRLLTKRMYKALED